MHTGLDKRLNGGELTNFPFPFQAQEYKGPQCIRSGTDLLKAAITCHCLHFGKISEIKSLFKPPFPIEIYTIRRNPSPDDFRKNSLVFSKISSSVGYLQLTPTNAQLPHI